MRCWEQALILRQSTEDIGPFPQDLDERFQRTFGHILEITLLEQWQDLLAAICIEYSSPFGVTSYTEPHRPWK